MDATLTALGNRYRIVDVIGEGGIGCVYRAEEVATRKLVALKLLRPEFAAVPLIARRFEREAQVTTRLAHPNIVEIVEFGQLEGHLFIAMELLAGQSLADVIDAGSADSRARLTEARTLTIMRQVLAALEHAHGHGVVHRDLKPENIMLVSPRGPLARERVKLLDFGIAQLDELGQGAQKLTQAGLALGTPRYMSPEQALGQTTDGRSDLYACGVILYELLTGRAPFEADSVQEVLSMHVSVPPAPLSDAFTGVPIAPALQRVVLRALAKRPEERFPSARELAVALARAARGGDRSADVSGLEETVLAVAPLHAPSRARWLRLQTIALALFGTALLIDGHRPVKHAVSTHAISTKGQNAVAMRPRSAPEPLRPTVPPPDVHVVTKRARSRKR
jgi:serine/threonine-protein kinase